MTELFVSIHSSIDLWSGSYNVTLAVNDVGGQTLGGAMLDKYIFGADVSSASLFRLFSVIVRWFHRLSCWCMTSRTCKVSRISKIGITRWISIVPVENRSSPWLAVKVGAITRQPRSVLLLFRWSRTFACRQSWKASAFRQRTRHALVFRLSQNRWISRELISSSHCSFDAHRSAEKRRRCDACHRSTDHPSRTE